MKISTKIKNLPIKYVLPLLLAVVLFAAAFPAPVSLSAAAPTSSATAILAGLDTQDAPQRPATIGLRITGQIPTANTGNSRLDNELRERWDAQKNAFVQNHMAGALSIDSDVEYFISGRYVSVVFTKVASSVSTTAAVSTTVIDASSASIITLPDFNTNIVQLINNRINKEVAARPHNFSNFSGIDSSHPFYLDGDRLVIPFGSAELIPTERGIHDISFSISNIEEETFSSNHFRVLGPNQYNTIMVRVADVMQRFGYDIEWDNDTRTVEVLMDGRLVSTLAIGENSYQYRGGRARELEVAPMLFSNLTYVPLSFFNEVVGMPATVNPDGVIVSRYRSASSAYMTSGFLAE
ncbi:MAG: copper amine oxidase N-terminal domain-containing protein [Clostridiales bacterium]|jgi:hypothetical protein|nr:copper amine oxidase N-terminal domain-containing protein [Clostridiales bacterium]